MPHLRLYLLGPPRLELDGEPVHLPRRKAMALLIKPWVTRFPLAASGGTWWKDTVIEPH